MATPESPKSKKAANLFTRYSSVSSEHSEADYSIANEVLPMRVSLETVEIGAWKYTSTELDDIELLYELESSDLVVSTNVRGSNDAVPATFHIRDVTAADLSLVNIVPDSLESMVVRMGLETDRKISYIPHTSKKTSENESEDIIGEDEPVSKYLDVYISRFTASVHETGHLRDILVFLKREYQGELTDLGADPMFVREKPVDTQSVMEDSASKPQLTLIESLPYWAFYIPWMLYSQRTRRVVQRILFLYTIFAMLWAMWQLYRHVNIIRVVIQPVIITLKYYLSPLFDLLDWMFVVFTLWWNTFLSPLNVLRGLLTVPMLNALAQLKHLFYPLYLFFTQFLQSTGLLAALSSALSTAWMLVKFTVKPLSYVWQCIQNSRVASMDFQRLRISWVFSLVLNFIRSICRAFSTVIGYTRKEKKIKKAMQSASTPVVSPISSPRSRRGTMPILYKSPLSKQ